MSKKKLVVALITIGAAVAAVTILALWRSYQSKTLHEPMDRAKEAFEKKDYAEVKRIVEPLASAGYFAAQRELALLYALGRGVDQDDYAAQRWLRLAAQGLAKELGDHSECHGPDRIYAAETYSFAKDMERWGELDASTRWFKYASDVGYDPKICPIQ